MELKELLDYRVQLLVDCRDGDGYISEEGCLDNALPALNETKYIDTTDVTPVFASIDNGATKINAYSSNESGERLHLFIVNESSLDLKANDHELLVAQKSFYEKQFSRALSFVKKSVKGQIESQLQSGSPAWLLVNLFDDVQFLEQTDVIEIFLISATATIESRGSVPSAKNLEFDDDILKIAYQIKGQTATKEITVMRKLIDLNFLYNVHVAQGSRYPLVIDFSQQSTGPIPFLHAASEKDFDSYLCALPATLLAHLYKRHSSRLLEKNVRSFLQITRGPNKGMHETIKTTPEKFVAYNNGLTITATSSKIISLKGVPHISSLSDFQIVNGGQTTATLFFAQKLGSSIDAIRVMAKINVAKDATDEVLDELISNISKYANSQSKVSNVDLRARNPQLVKLKSLSESILTSSGKKWFFERAKGEYATMLRINNTKRTQLEKSFPKERRFTKEELAKYYAAWGEIPYAVKRGGEKVFRIFIEEISGEGKEKRAIEVDRAFYEDLIARIIMFRTLEKLYGSGNNSIGQLRSAVVPYTISILYKFTTGNKHNKPFNMERVWKAESLESDLANFLKSLMILVNALIKKYSPSDDYGEFSKRKELWEKIVESTEIKDVVNGDEFYKIYEKYTVVRKAKKGNLKAPTNDNRQWETPLCYWSAVQLPGYTYSQKKQAWWKNKSK